MDKLISDGYPRWKNELIHNLFNSEEANLIQTIPLSSVDREDQFTWNYIQNGNHMVKSAYHLHKAFLNRNNSEPSHGLGQQGTWKLIWNLKATNVVKTFIWRAFKAILPTLTNLKKGE